MWSPAELDRSKGCRELIWKPLFLFFLVSLHLVCSRDQRQPGRYRTAGALLPPLETPLVPLPQSQTGTQSLPGTVVIGGCWQVVGEEIQLDVDNGNSIEI